ncbi:MAG: hypothetical protein WC280_03000 [Patescibacteria group bacterium]
MKFLVKSTNPERLKSVIRRFSYAYIFDKRSGKESFAKRLGGGYYPRFHLYLEERGDDTIFSLHLDQKKASYQGQTMHSAEYDGELVEEEIVNMRNYVASLGFETQFLSSHSNAPKKKEESYEEEDVKIPEIKESKDILSEMASGNLDEDLEDFVEDESDKKKKGFFSIF